MWPLEQRFAVPGYYTLGADRRWHRIDPYDAVQDTRSETRYEWTEGDVADDAAEAFRWGYGQAATAPEDCGCEQ